MKITTRTEEVTTAFVSNLDGSPITSGGWTLSGLFGTNRERHFQTISDLIDWAVGSSPFRDEVRRKLYDRGYFIVLP